MLCRRAVSSRSIPALVTVLAATFSAPALAQGFAPGMTIFSGPDGRNWNRSPALSEDGFAIATNLRGDVFGENLGAVIQPNTISVFQAPSTADDVSDGGSYSTGYVVRRDAAGNEQVLLPGQTRPFGSQVRTHISGDGSAIAGTLEDTLDFPTQAFRWTQESGSQVLPAYRTGALYNRVNGISRDGSTIVGDGSMFFGTSIEAWKWTAADGFTILPPAPGGRLDSTSAQASNGNGSIIVGLDGDPTFGTRAVIWMNEVPTVIPTPAGYRSCFAHDLSDDGSLILGRAGSSQIGLPETDVVWTEASGWIPALDFLRSRGVDIPSYYTGGGRFEVSADGRTFTTILTDTRTGERPLAVFVIPSPSGLALLGLFIVSSRRARARMA